MILVESVLSIHITTGSVRPGVERISGYQTRVECTLERSDEYLSNFPKRFEISEIKLKEFNFHYMNQIVMIFKEMVIH